MRSTSCGIYVFVGGARLDRVLAVAGFRAVHREALTLPIRIGADVDDVIGYRHRWRDAAECGPGNYDEPLPRAI